MKLSDRLETVISMVEQAETAADIGTDHGHVPVELVRRGIVKRALAMDIRKGPLSKAEERIRSAGLQDVIGSRLSDGLEKLLPGEAHSVIIAGMGGELIIHILERGRHMWDSTEQWILSPHSEVAKVRAWLWNHGFPVEREEMVCEDGKYYTILDVKKRNENLPDSREERDDRCRACRYGLYLIRQKNPVFLQYLKEEEEKLEALAEELKSRAAVSERALISLRETEEKLKTNLEVQNEVQRGN